MLMTKIEFLFADTIKLPTLVYTFRRNRFWAVSIKDNVSTKGVLLKYYKSGMQLSKINFNCEYAYQLVREC